MGNPLLAGKASRELIVQYQDHPELIVQCQVRQELIVQRQDPRDRHHPKTISGKRLTMLLKQIQIDFKDDKACRVIAALEAKIHKCQDRPRQLIS